MMADAGEDILQAPPPGFVKQHVIGDHAGDPQGCGAGGKFPQPKLIIGPPLEREREMGACAEELTQSAQARPQRVIGAIGDEDGDQPRGMGGEIVPGEMASPLAAAALAQGEQAAEPGIGGPVGRIDEHRGAIAKIEPAADDQANTTRFRCFMGAHDPSERVVIGDRERSKAKGCGGRE